MPSRWSGSVGLEAPLDSPAPVFVTVTDRFGGKRYHSPNDLAIRCNGDVYFTDPPYGLEHGADDPAKEQDVHGVYRVAANGSVTLLVANLSRPNGIAFTPNEEILYVARAESVSWSSRPTARTWAPS